VNLAGQITAGSRMPRGDATSETFLVCGV